MSSLLSENGRKILGERYIDKEHDKTVEGMWDRVSMGNPEYRKVMEDLLFLPNSPTLFNLGLPFGGTLSACFVFDVDDSLLGDWPDGGSEEPWITSILGTNFKAACVAKAGGGVGYYLGKLRPKGALVRSTHKKACGPVTVLKYFQYLRSLVTQGGKRDLAQMAVLNADHPDIREFIHCKDDDPQALSAFNISVSWRDAMLNQIYWNFLERSEQVNTPTGLWYEQAVSAWKTGCPGMLFWDTINQANATPHLGDINATNPCGETPNLNDEPCNLGSMAVCRFLEGVGKTAKFDWKKLQQYVRLCIRFMDDILDANKFPHPSITKMAFATRKLGLGVMGWADLLALMHIPYDSEEAINFGVDLMKTINDTALSESVKLADEKGPYPAYESAPQEVKAKFPRCRNSTRTSIAPTGTIAIIADVWGSIEPHFALECTRTTYEGIKMTDGVPEWVKEKLNGFSDFRPKIASEIDWRWHVRHQAAFQKYTDLGVSKTINMPESATIKDVSDAYWMMWKSGCKGGTIFREGCRKEAVLVKSRTSVYSTGTSRSPNKLDLPNELDAKRKRFNIGGHIGGHKGYAHAGLHLGKVVEIFVRMNNPGSAIEGMVNTWCIAFSKALQGGESLEKMVSLTKNHRFEPNGFTGDKDIPICTSIPDFVVRWLELRFLPKKEERASVPERDTLVGSSPKTGQLCPNCACELIMQSGCLVCTSSSCGWSSCG
jgi:ribonucleoside-diphosphate reductase alpha chain